MKTRTGRRVGARQPVFFYQVISSEMRYGLTM
jgi:hypothetical protein